jgi:hypothetical protein
MQTAFPSSEYYDGSARPDAFSRRRTYPAPTRTAGSGNNARPFPRSLATTRWTRCPALPLRHRCGYAVDLPRSLPRRKTTTSAESSPPPPPHGRYAPPTQAISARFDLVITLRSFTTPVPHVHRSISPTGPAPSGSTGTPRPRRGCFPPSPASPGSGCLPLHPARYDRPQATVSHRRKVTSASWRTSPDARSAPPARRSPAPAGSARSIQTRSRTSTSADVTDSTAFSMSTSMPLDLDG